MRLMLSTFSVNGCAADGTATTTGSPPGSASSTSSASAAEADIAFAQLMIPHHQQAIEMADLATTRATAAEVKALAAQIRAAQDPEMAARYGL